MSGTSTGAGSVTDAQAPDIETLPPVPPVPPVIRRPQQPEDQPPDTNSGTSGDTAAGKAGATPLRRQPAQTHADRTRADTPPQVTLGSRSFRPSTGYLAQSLSQENLGAGLYIEPWKAAISSYHAAAALPGAPTSTTRLTA